MRFDPGNPVRFRYSSPFNNSDCGRAADRINGMGRMNDQRRLVILVGASWTYGIEHLRSAEVRRPRNRVNSTSRRYILPILPILSAALPQSLLTENQERED
jgi:hypothetical protein